MLRVILNKAFIFQRKYEFLLVLFQQIDAFRGLTNFVNDELLQRALLNGNGVIFQMLYENYAPSISSALATQNLDIIEHKFKEILHILRVAITCHRS